MKCEVAKILLRVITITKFDPFVALSKKSMEMVVI